MIKELDATNESTAGRILQVQIPAYKVEAEIINFHGIPQLKDTVHTIMSSGETFIGYFEKEELAGCISYMEDAGEIDICRLVVHPDHFRKGIAKKLVAHVTEEIAKDKKVIVSTGAKNQPAKRLYHLFGFQEVKDIEVAPGVFITLLERQKSPN